MITNGPAMLQKWLTGYGYTEGLAEFVKQFPEAKHNGMVYRGMFFDHYPSIDEIRNSDFCSWTTSREVAEYFAAHSKYGVVLSKQSTGYDVEKILNTLRTRGELPERLKNYRSSASEKEVLDSLNVNNVKIFRVGIK